MDADAARRVALLAEERARRAKPIVVAPAHERPDTRVLQAVDAAARAMGAAAPAPAAPAAPPPAAPTLLERFNALSLAGRIGVLLAVLAAGAGVGGGLLWLVMPPRRLTKARSRRGRRQRRSRRD